MTDASHDGPAVSNRSSIDLSLELERQLDSESLPGSPGIHRDTENRASLDPHVLAHIVTQLRDSLTYLTQERDDLVHQLAESHTREAEFKDSLTLCTERCVGLEADLEAIRKKSQDDEEAISMLRSKVEESRRGLMRLQSERNAENKRMTLDVSNARTPSFGSGPRSSNRASFTPLTGSGHPGPTPSFRRSVSSTNGVDSDQGFAEFVAGLPVSPGCQTLVLNESAENSSAQSSRRRSIFSSVNRSSASQLEGRLSPSSAETESLKQELAAVKAELDDTRHELTESNEAREASESCVNALRDFIGQLGSSDSGPARDVQGLRLPPLPTDAHVNTMEPEPKQKSSGWGSLKLWRVDTTASSSSPASVSNNAGRPSMESCHTVGSDLDNTIVSPSTAVPLRNKFGAFFTRGPISSITHPLPQSHQEEHMLNGSDVSSLTEERSEPTSPTPEKGHPVFVQEPLAELQEGGTVEPDSTPAGYDPHPAEDGNTVKFVAL